MRKTFLLLFSLCVAPALVRAGASPEVVNARYASGRDVAVRSDGFTASGKSVGVTLNFAPAKDQDLTVVQNTGSHFINGKFNNLAHRQIVTLHYGNAAYHFIANYYGGSGRDLVLTHIDLDNLSAAAQSKLDSNLLLALNKSRGQAPFDRPTTLRPEDYEKEGRVLVEIQTSAPTAVANQIKALGGQPIPGWQTATSVRAWIPASELEKLAGLPDVQSVSAARPSITHRIAR
jgi:hypothetical protein